MAKYKYKVGDEVIARLFGGKSVAGTIECIEFDKTKHDYVADLSCGHWCYLSQIVKRV